MVNIIVDIYNILVELYQHIPGIPEGITYAIFGLKKKKKKAKRQLASTARKKKKAGAKGKTVVSNTKAAKVRS